MSGYFGKKKKMVASPNQKLVFGEAALFLVFTKRN